MPRLRGGSRVAGRPRRRREGLIVVWVALAFDHDADVGALIAGDADAAAARCLRLLGENHSELLGQVWRQQARQLDVTDEDQGGITYLNRPRGKVCECWQARDALLRPPPPGRFQQPASVVLGVRGEVGARHAQGHEAHHAHRQHLRAAGWRTVSGRRG